MMYLLFYIILKYIRLEMKKPSSEGFRFFSIAAHLSLDKPPWLKLGWWDYSRPDDTRN